MQSLVEIFSNLSNIYYKYANDLLRCLPDSLLSNCILTNLELEEDSESIKNYDNLKVSLKKKNFLIFCQCTIIIIFIRADQIMQVLW